MTVEQIVEAGMAVFAEVGYERLSMRLVAARLRVQPGSLYYHVKNKSVLLALMADRVAQECQDAGRIAVATLPADASPRQRIRAQVAALRVALKRHPGGVLLFTASPQGLGPGALGLMERLLDTLTEAGLAGDDAIVTADILLSYATGFVLQEQAEPMTEPLRPPGVPAEQFPLTAQLAGRFDDNAMFDRAIDRLLDLVTP